MSWIALALVSTVMMAVVNNIDSHILTRRVGQFSTYLLIVGVVLIPFGVFSYFAAPWPEAATPGMLLAAFGSAGVRVAAVTIMLYSFRTAQVSRAVPVIYSYPVLVAALAMPLLGETLSAVGWIAVLVTVTGTILVSLRRSPGGSHSLGKGFFTLVAAGVLFAASDLSSKYVLSYLSYWKLFSLTLLLMSGLWIAITARPETFRRVRDMDRRNLVLTLICLSEAVAQTGILLGMNALAIGPVSLVSAILGSRPIFVTLFALGITYVSPGFLATEPVHERFALKLTATGMIVAGIAMIYLS